MLQTTEWWHIEWLWGGGGWFERAHRLLYKLDDYLYSFACQMQLRYFEIYNHFAYLFSASVGRTVFWLDLQICSYKTLTKKLPLQTNYFLAMFQESSLTFVCLFWTESHWQLDGLVSFAYFVNGSINLLDQICRYRPFMLLPSFMLTHFWDRHPSMISHTWPAILASLNDSDTQYFSFAIKC